MSKAKSGGGANSKVVRQVGIKSGSANIKAISPAAAADIGIKKGNHASEGGGKTLQRPADPLIKATPKDRVPMGNAVATNVGKGGPGAGRTVHRSGSQGQHGPAAGSAAPQGRDILSAFSPKKG